MRAALVFPPQWDPRQPPLAPAVLAAAFKSSEADTKIFDLNIALYRHLIHSKIPGGIEDFILERLLNPTSLCDAQSYLQTSEQIQKIFDKRFDQHGMGRLFWDTCRGLPSETTSSDWLKSITNPDKIPFFHHLKCEISDITEWNPDLIGISVISDTQLHAALSLAAFFRDNLPDSQIILGGNAITYRRSLLPTQDCLKSTIDAVCLGDGEPLLSAISTDNHATNAPNTLSWSKTGQIRTGNSKLHDLSDSHLPNFDSLPLKQYLTPHLVIPIETARGCPWGKCSFCIHPVKAATGRPSYRQKSIKLVAAEIKHLFACGHRRFLIVDEAITPKRLLELSDLFNSLPAPVSWIGYIRLSTDHSFDGFIRARAAGCLKLFIGVESGSDRILEKFNKGVTSKLARRILIDIAKADIAVHFFLMTGFPGEIESDRQATLDLLSNVLPAFNPFGVSFDLFPLSGELETDLMANPNKYGWNGPKRDSSNDLAWQFPILSGKTATKIISDFRNRIDSLADKLLGPAFGLRHALLAQDSLHLLLLEARK